MMSDYSDGTVELGSARSTTVTGFFDNRVDAETAAERLRGLGCPQVRVTEGQGDAADAVAEDPAEPRGLFERLGDFLFPEEDRSTFAEGLSRGGFLVTTTGLSSAMYDVVMDALEDAGAVDIDERAANWRSEGWSSGDIGTSGLSGMSESGLQAGGTSGLSAVLGASTRSDGAEDTDETVPVVQERLRVGKRDTSHGRVRVRSYVVEEPVTETVRLEAERVEVERRPVDRAVGSGDGDLFAERSIEAEEFAQEAVVSKEARVVEEVSLHRSHDSHDETISDTVRRTEVEVDDQRDAEIGGPAARQPAPLHRPATEAEVEAGLTDDDDDLDTPALTERDINRP